MKRKNYQKPTMKIVMLRQQSQLLVGSGLAASRNAYNPGRSDGGAVEDPEIWQ